MKTVFEIIICDDDVIDLDLIRKKTAQILDRNNIPHNITCYSDGSLLLQDLLHGSRPAHLLLLDILMKPSSGMDVAGQLMAQNRNIPIIFITATSEFALTGYRVNVSRYLLKPLVDADLEEAVLFCLQQGQSHKNILLKCENSYYKAVVSEIQYLEIEGHNLKVFLLGRPAIITPMNMANAEDILPSDIFFRCHQSFLVNLAYVRSICRYHLILEDGTSIPVSKSRYEGTRNRILEFLSF